MWTDAGIHDSYKSSSTEPGFIWESWPDRAFEYHECGNRESLLTQAFSVKFCACSLKNGRFAHHLTLLAYEMTRSCAAYVFITNRLLEWSAIKMIENILWVKTTLLLHEKHENSIRKCLWNVKIHHVYIMFTAKVALVSVILFLTWRLQVVANFNSI